ncbi:MAG TPA: hypothetical protein VEB22_00940, partial [Phycisphaerales bacterium]|nr:hypothetical protein [Phycisphaerales bacterium]
SFTTPAAEDTDPDGNLPNPADQARTVTQRMRLAFSAARELLRHRPPGAPSPAGDRPKPPPAAPAPPGTQRAAQERPAASTILAAAGAAVSRFGERSIADAAESPEAPHTPALAPHRNLSASVSDLVRPQAPLTSAPDSPHESDPGAQRSPAPPPRPELVYPPTPAIYKQYAEHKRPPIPARFTDEELDAFERTLRTDDPFPKRLYNRLVEWWNHCGCYGFTHPLPVTSRLLDERNPFTRNRAAVSAQPGDAPGP